MFTPDGQTIVFPSARAGSVTLWQIPVGRWLAVAADLRRRERHRPRHFCQTARRWCTRTFARLQPGDDRSSHGRGDGIARAPHRSDGPTFSPNGRSDRVLPTDRQRRPRVHGPHRRQELTQITAREGEVNVFPQLVGRWIVPVLLSGKAKGFAEENSGRRRRRDRDRTVAVAELRCRRSPGRVGWRTRRPAERQDVCDRRPRSRDRQETTLANAIEPTRWSHDGRTIFGTEYPDPAARPGPARSSRATADGPCRILAEGRHRHTVQRRFPGLLPQNRSPWRR